MLEVFRQSGHEVLVVEHKNGFRTHNWLRTVRNVLRELARIPSYRQLYQRIRPDVVYVNTSVSLPSVLAARGASIPVVWHLRELTSDLGGELVLPRGLRSVLGIVYRRAPDKVVVNSRAVAENLLGSAVGVDVVPNAVAEKYFSETRSREEARAILGLPMDVSILGIPGTLRPAKGHKFLLQALPRVLHHIPHLLVTVSGTGSQRFESELRQLVDTLRLTENVRFLGSIADMPAFYRASDVVCIPSRSESFGRAVIEAMASSRALVATAVGGIVEIIDDGRTGFLVEYGDEKALADRVVRLLTDEALRETFGSEGHEVATRLYREAAYQDRLREIVESCSSNT